MVWREIVRLGGPAQVEMKWCKGHATSLDVDMGRTTGRLRVLNDTVDKLAGLGSELACELAQNAAERIAYARAKHLYEWLAMLIANWPKEVQRAPRPEQRESSVLGRRAKWLWHALRPHDLWRQHSVLACAACGRRTRCRAQWRLFVAPLVLRQFGRAPVSSSLMSQRL